MWQLFKFKKLVNQDVPRKSVGDGSLSSIDRNILFKKNPSDIRPYLKVKILNLEAFGLLDSGAYCSILGNDSHLTFIEHGFKLNNCSSEHYVKTADGTSLHCVGYMTLPIEFNNVFKVVNFYVVPQITTPIIFGVNFWQQFDLGKGFISGLDSNLTCDLISDRYINSVSLNDGLEDYECLTSEQKTIIDNLVKKFDTINTTKVGLGKTTLAHHTIDTADHKPIKQRYYPLSPIKQQALEKELDKMLSLGVVSPSQSPWNSPIVMVTKPNGDLRLCLDCRKLNSVSKPDAYPLPYISSILDQLRDAKYLTSIDLSAAYWQIPYDSELSAEKTAFTVPRRGLYQFNVMCFGLVGASATMQRLMDKLFGAEFDNKVFCFQDDIIVISSTFSEHINLLQKVYTKLKNANLTINMEKSVFCRKELKYLGYLVDKHGLRTDPGKVDIILNYPTPTSAKEVKRFLGMSGWYRRFINNFSKICKPLSKLTCKNIPFKWTDEAEESFNHLKTALVSAPILKCPNFNMPFTIHSDASSMAIGAVLTQTHDDVEHPIAYCSRSLNKNEINYSTTERELLAVIYALEQFRTYVEGQKCKIVTDHSSLLWFYKLKNPSGRLARWSMRLSQFDFDIEHRKGKLNIIPDALSRIKIDAIGPAQHTNDAWYNNLFKNCNSNPRRYPNYLVKDDKLFRYSKNKYHLTDDFDWKLVVPEEDRLSILQKCHDEPTSAHLGIFKTHKRLSLHYYWPSMYNDVKTYIKKCEICKQYKPVNTARPGLMGNPKEVSKPFEAICCDLLGPFPASRNRNVYLIVCTDYFSKYIMLHPIRTATGAAVAKFLEDRVFLVHGACKSIYIDNGPQFISTHFRQLMHKYNVPNVYYNARYHAQVNAAERAIRNVVNAIACYVGTEHKKWDENIPKLQYALNTAVNETTKFTPYFLVHARECVIDGTLHSLSSDQPVQRSEVTVGEPQKYSRKLAELDNIFKKVQKHLKASHHKNEKYYNLRKRHHEFKVGQVVYKRTYYLSNASKKFTSKLAPKFQKCVITAKLSPLVYTLTSMDGKPLGNYHIKDILKQEEE